MKISAKLTAVIFAAIAAFASVSCEKRESTIKPEEILGSFTYEGNTYNIRSVVVYPLDNGQTEIWISETAGYTTVDQIETSVGGLVLMVPNRIITQGNKESIDPQRNPIQFIKYDDKTNSGFATLKCSLNKENKTIDLEFSSAELKSSANAIAGSYKGPYSEYSVPALNNQWAYNRQAKDIVSADYFEMEDGGPSRLVIYDDNSKAIEISIPFKHIGVPVNIKKEDSTIGATAKYDDGEEFEIESGNIHIVPRNTEIELHIKLSNAAGRTLRADYKGAYRHRFGNKANRCIFDSASEGYGYNGKFLIDAMKVSDSTNDVTFTFTPGAHTTSGTVDKVQVPTLRISKQYINAGEIDLVAIPKAWDYFYYHNFQVYSFNETSKDRTIANPGSVMSIECDENGKYTVNLEVSYMVAKVVTTDKVDENGNIEYEIVQKKDENGTPLFDEDDNPIMEQVPVKIQTTIDVPASIDLFFKEQAN